MKKKKDDYYLLISDLNFNCEFCKFKCVMWLIVLKDEGILLILFGNMVFKICFDV